MSRNAALHVLLVRPSVRLSSTSPNSKPFCFEFAFQRDWANKLLLVKLPLLRAAKYNKCVCVCVCVCATTDLQQQQLLLLSTTIGYYYLSGYGD